jgi:ribonuclease E
VDETISDIVVDSEHAWTRVTAFLDVVFPKDAPEVRFYDRPAPVFNAFDLERQISDIYQRQVPLPSGGALVFDQTEALVAIDVNSGKSRSARDSETNAFETNKEAVDEICRQLRLRDMGGLVVCDLIDMRSPRHRREIEQRFRQNLKKDRAKSTVGPISEFGLVELTRQRMRPSVRKAHFSECPHCTGSGEVRMPDSTAAEALRRVLTLFGSDRIHRVEMVCSVRVASVLLSSRRDQLIEIERDSGKRIDVRISEAIAADRVDLYAYDDRGADVEIERLPSPPLPRLAELPVEPPEEPAEPRGDGEEPVESRPRRRRRRRKAQPADATAMLLSGAFDDLPEVADDEPSVLDQLRAKESRERAERKAREAEAKAAAGAEQIGDDAGQEAGEDSTTGDGERRGRKRRRRRGRNRDGQPRTDKARTTATAGDGDASPQDHAEGAEATSADAEDAAKGESTGGEGGTGDRKRRRRRRGGRGRRRESGAEAANPDGGPEAQGASSDRAGSSELGDGGRDGRRRGSRRSGTDAPGSGHEGGGSAPAPAAPATGESANGDAAKPKGVFRSLYGAALRRLNPGAARDALKKDS